MTEDTTQRKLIETPTDALKIAVAAYVAVKVVQGFGGMAIDGVEYIRVKRARRKAK